MSKGIFKLQEYLLITLHDKGGATTEDVLCDCFFEEERYSGAWDSERERIFRKDRIRVTRNAMVGLMQRGLVQNIGKSELGPPLCVYEGKSGYRLEKTIWALTERGAISASEWSASSNAEYEDTKAERRKNMTPQEIDEFDNQQARIRESIKRLAALLE